jgi:flagellar biosynthesis protein FliR
VLAKVAPQVNVYMESLPVKSFVGLAVLAVAIGFIFVRLEAHFSRFFWRMYTVIGGLA